MSLRFFFIFVVVGLVGVLIGWFVDGERGLIGIGAAWTVCLIPIAWAALHRWVAKKSVNSKMKVKQGLPVGAREILTRMAWVLGASFVLYWHYGPQLGVGFWLAVLVYYQIALALQTIDRLRDQPR